MLGPRMPGLVMLEPQMLGKPVPVKLVPRMLGMLALLMLEPQRLVH